MQNSKKDWLWHRLRHIGLFSSHTVREIGREMFYDSADRAVRRMTNEGKFRRLPDSEIILKGLRKPGNARLSWYEAIK